MRSPATSGGRPGRSPGAAGFSLVELLVSLVILLIGLSIAAELGVRSHAILARSVRDARRPPMAAVLARLRADVQGAERLDPPQSAGLSGWTAAPLVLHQSHGLTLYRFEGAAIERVAFDLAGHELGRLALVREGAAWRWRQIDAGLVEVSIAFLAAPGAPGAAGRAIHRDTLRLTLRGAPGRWGW